MVVEPAQYEGPLPRSALAADVPEKDGDRAHAALALSWARAIEPVAVTTLMVSYGAFALFLLVRHYERGGVTETDERSLYVLGSVLTPVLGLAVGWLWLRARQTIFRDAVAAPFVMAAANALFWPIALFLLKRDIELGPGEAKVIVGMTRLCWGFVLTNLTALALCFFGSRLRLSLLQRQVVRRAIDNGYFVLPWAGAAAAALFSNYTWYRWSTFPLPCACALLGWAASRRRSGLGLKAGWSVDVGALLLIVALVFNPRYPSDLHHYSFFLGPVASLLAGKRVLVDINCQYGVGVVYFLAAMFKLHLVPATYQGMSAVLNVLGIWFFSVLYILLRLCLKSRGYCLLILVVMLAVRVFSFPYFYTIYPSIGPLRFMWGYMVLLCLALKERFPRRAGLFRTLAAAAVGITSIWSAETFAGALVTFLAVVGYELLYRPEKGKARRWREAALSTGSALLGVAVAHALLSADVRATTGRWPDWSQYFAYLEFYSKWDNWAMPITTWEPWAPIVFVYFTSLVVLLARPLLFRRPRADLAHTIVFGMTILGIVEFSHYIGRSHVDHLRIYVADIFIAGYFFERIALGDDAVSPAFRAAFVACAYGAVGLLLLSTLPGFSQKLGETLLGPMAADQSIVLPGALSPDAAWIGTDRAQIRSQAVELIQKYQAGKRRVALFIDETIRPLVFLELGVAHVWPISLPVQDGIEPKAKARTLDYADGLAKGDLIFVGPGVAPLEEEILTGLQKRFQFAEVASSPAHIRVIRLDARP